MPVASSASAFAATVIEPSLVRSSPANHLHGTRPIISICVGRFSPWTPKLAMAWAEEMFMLPCCWSSLERPSPSVCLESPSWLVLAFAIARRPAGAGQPAWAWSGERGQRAAACRAAAGPAPPPARRASAASSSRSALLAVFSCFSERRVRGKRHGDERRLPGRRTWSRGKYLAHQFIDGRPQRQRLRVRCRGLPGVAGAQVINGVAQSALVGSTASVGLDNDGSIQVGAVAVGIGTAFGSGAATVVNGIDQNAIGSDANVALTNDGEININAESGVIPRYRNRQCVGPDGYRTGRRRYGSIGIALQRRHP